MQYYLYPGVLVLTIYSPPHTHNMRHHLSLTILLSYLFINAASGQSGYHDQVQRIPFIAKHLHHTSPSRHFASKSTATGSRLTKEVNTNFDGISLVPTDSTVYVYSGSRGGDLDHTMKFDTALQFAYDGGNYDNGYRAIQVFDASNNITYTKVYAWDPSGNAWVNSDSVYYSYDANNNLLKTTVTEWDINNSNWVNLNRDSSVYNAGNEEISHTWQDWDGNTGTWVNNEEDIYTHLYNQTATTLIKAWNAPQWDSIVFFHNIFDASHNIMITEEQDKDMATQLWVNQRKDSFTYDASNNKLTDLQYNWYNDSSRWIKSRFTAYSNFTGHSPQTETIQDWDDLTQLYNNEKKTNNSYNSFEQLTAFTNESWINNNWVSTFGDYGGRYYYEDYSLHVTTLSANKGDISVYPVPADQELSVRITWDEPQLSTMNITDMRGLLVKTLELPIGSDVRQTISLGDIPAGNYLISVDGTKGHLTQKLTIQR